METRQSNLGFGISFGKEYRKNIADNLELRFGADVSFRYIQSKWERDDKSIDNRDKLRNETKYMPGINLVFGLNYVINDNLVLGAELLPNFSYTTGNSVEKYHYENDGEEIKSDISGFNYGLRNTSVLLSLAYRFN